MNFLRVIYTTKFIIFCQRRHLVDSSLQRTRASKHMYGHTPLASCVPVRSHQRHVTTKTFFVLT